MNTSKLYNHYNTLEANKKGNYYAISKPTGDFKWSNKMEGSYEHY